MTVLLWSRWYTCGITVLHIAFMWRKIDEFTAIN